MRKPLPRLLYIVLSLFICIFFATSAFGQTPDPQATPTPDPRQVLLPTRVRPPTILTRQQTLTPLLRPLPLTRTASI